MANPTEAAAPALDAGALWDALLPVSLKEHGIRVIEEFLARAAGGKVEGGTDPHYCGDCQALADEGWGMWCDKHTPNGPIPAPSIPEKPGLTAVCRLCGKSRCSCWSTPAPAEGQGGREVGEIRQWIVTLRGVLEQERSVAREQARKAQYEPEEAMHEGRARAYLDCIRLLTPPPGHPAYLPPSPHPPEKPSEGRE